MNRLLSPSTNATGIGAAVGFVWAGAVMTWNAARGHGVIDPQVITAAIAGAAFLYTRFRVTPVADPKDGAGRPLVPAEPTEGIK